MPSLLCLCRKENRFHSVAHLLQLLLNRFGVLVQSVDKLSPITRPYKDAYMFEEDVAEVI
jgi:hypothetical protein